MGRELFLTVSAIPPASEATSEAVSSLRASLGKRFSHSENGAYLDALMRGTPQVAIARLTALSLLPALLDLSGVNCRDTVLSRDAQGRPFAKGSPGLDFNLSHSDAHAVCALLIGGGTVGVDVEEPLSPDRAARLMQRYAADEEHARFDIADPQPWEGFARLWTLREALAKQDGRGQPLNFDATAVPPYLCLHGGHLPDTGAALALCVPEGVDLNGIHYHPRSLPIVWDIL